ncbi:MAG: hypothetical protein HY263_08865 [Chloroflexi bacterium]|nr:hypothetical protein [Chloroflexota bacterium]
MPGLRHRRRATYLLRLILAGLVATLAVAACGPSDGSATPGIGRASGEPTERPIATVPADPTLAAAVGPWRRVPAKADPAFGATFVAGCRAAEAAIGSMPARVVDVRGRGWITVLLASDTAAFLCRTTVDDPAHPVEIRSVTVPSATIATDQIDLALWTQVRISPETITYAVGRVGPEPADVIGGYVDQTFVFATHENGWWVAWWPPQAASDGFAAVDHGHVVLNEVKAPASGEFPDASAGASP